MAARPADRGRDRPTDRRRPVHYRHCRRIEGEYTLTIRRDFGAEVYQEKITLRAGQVVDKTFRLSRDAEEKAVRDGAGGFSR